MQNLQDKIKAARRCGVPLILITTTDEPATADKIRKTLNGSSPVLLFDVVRGLQASNEPGQTAYTAIIADNDPALFTDPVSAFAAATERAPDNTVIIAHGAQRYIQDSKTGQAIANWRNPAKATLRTAILLAAPGTIPPADIATDIYSIDDNPPDSSAQRKKSPQP